jgi:hypothetical protein
MIRTVCLFLFVVVLTTCADKGTRDAQWREEQFQEITSLSGLPISIQEALGVGRAGFEGIADAGGAFNATDVVRENLPGRRFTIAGISNTHVLAAIERGGRGHYFEILLFELPRTQKDRWTLFEKPTNLRALLDSLPNKR